MGFPVITKETLRAEEEVLQSTTGDAKKHVEGVLAWRKHIYIGRQKPRIRTSILGYLIIAKTNTQRSFRTLMPGYFGKNRSPVTFAAGL